MWYDMHSWVITSSFYIAIELLSGLLTKRFLVKKTQGTLHHPPCVPMGDLPHSHIPANCVPPLTRTNIYIWSQKESIETRKGGVNASKKVINFAYQLPNSKMCQPCPGKGRKQWLLRSSHTLPKKQWFLSSFNLSKIKIYKLIHSTIAAGLALMHTHLH